MQDPVDAVAEAAHGRRVGEVSLHHLGPGAVPGGAPVGEHPHPYVRRPQQRQDRAAGEPGAAGDQHARAVHPAPPAARARWTVSTQV